MSPKRIHDVLVWEQGHCIRVISLPFLLSKQKTYLCSNVRGENKFFIESHRLQISKPMIQAADTAHEIPNVVDSPKNVGT